MPKHTPKHAPRPQNWKGVKAGLAECTNLLQRHELSSAENTVRQVLEFAPMEGQAWHLLGRILQKNNHHAEALNCFASAESCYGRHKQDQHSPVSIRLAHLLWGQGEYDAARAMLNTLVMRDPDDNNLQQLYEAWSHQWDEQNA